MSACEKCWAEAHLRAMMDPTKAQVEHYVDLLREHDQHPCSKEEQNVRTFPEFFEEIT
jgi:hypothetical protein